MARIARVVAPGILHHMTHRGNRRQETFFGAGDYRAYIGLMPKHVQLPAVPATEEGMRRAIVERGLPRTLRRGKPGPKQSGNS